MILFFAHGLRLVYKFMHTAKAFCAWLQSLASHSPNKNPHSNNSFGGYLMKVNLINFQHFNYKPAQWEPKPSFEESGFCLGFVVKVIFIFHLIFICHPELSQGTRCLYLFPLRSISNKCNVTPIDNLYLCLVKRNIHNFGYYVIGRFFRYSCRQLNAVAILNA